MSCGRGVKGLLSEGSQSSVSIPASGGWDATFFQTVLQFLMAFLLIELHQP